MYVSHFQNIHICYIKNVHMLNDSIWCTVAATVNATFY